MKWVKNLNFSLNPDSSFDSLGLLTPKVIKLPDGGFRMYYTGASNFSSGQILSAYSKNLKDWIKEHRNIIKHNVSDKVIRILSPDIIQVESKFWRMYYESRISNNLSVIMSAISYDLTHWTNEMGVRIKSNQYNVGTPKCIRLDDGSYRLFFYSYPTPFRCGIHARNHIVSAISHNGIEFELEDGVRVTQDNIEYEKYSVYAPEIVRKKNNSWIMYFSGWTIDQHGELVGRIFSANSNDSLLWLKDKSVVIDNGGIKDYRFASEPCVIEDDEGNPFMFYEACDSRGIKRILMAEHKI